MSARAAARLISLGFTQVYRYTAGKADWMANGWPAEGELVGRPRAGDLARKDLPTCSLSDQIGEVRQHVQAAGWDACAVVDHRWVVLGLLRKEALAGDPQRTAEEAMERAPRTYRLNGSPQKAAEYMQERGLDSVLVTCSDGTLHGLLRLQDAQRAQ